jgi:hypothetical protein
MQATSWDKCRPLRHILSTGSYPVCFSLEEYSEATFTVKCCCDLLWGLGEIWQNVVMPKMSINLEEIVSRSLQNFEEQNKVFESSIITTYCITINAYYNYMVSLLHSIIIILYF